MASSLFRGRSGSWEILVLFCRVSFLVPYRYQVFKYQAYSIYLVCMLVWPVWESKYLDVAQLAARDIAFATTLIS